MKHHQECIISSEKIDEANNNDSLNVSEIYHKIVNYFKGKEINPEALQKLFENWVYNNSKEQQILMTTPPITITTEVSGITTTTTTITTTTTTIII